MKINKKQLEVIIWVSFIIAGLLIIAAFMDAYSASSGNKYPRIFYKRILADVRFYIGLIFTGIGFFTIKSLQHNGDDSD